MRAKKLSNLIILLFTAAFAHAATRLVPAQYPNIQAAIDDCNDGDTVIVAPGTYTGSGNRDIDFRGKPITVRSTDPNDPQIVAQTIINCNGGPSSYHRGFNFHTGEGRNSILAGFTIVNGYADFGGAIVILYAASPTITHSRLCNNHAVYEGGAICASDCSPAITNCAITGNSAASGGGIDINNTVDSTLAIANCMITDNFADGSIRGFGSGGGIFLLRGNAIITNCTVANNSAVSTVGGITCYRNNPTITNSIIWGNSAPSTTNLSGQPVVSYSNIQGGFSGTGNIDTDPLFADLGSGDFHLSDSSPCIDAGDPAHHPAPGETDIDGQPRLFGGRVDMGADEMLFDGVAIALFPNLVRFSILEGQVDPPGETVQIWNAGLGTLNWRITEDCSWLRVNPQAGTSTMEPTQVILTVYPISLHWGHYNCQLTVHDPCAINSPQTVDVVLDLIGPEIEVSKNHVEFSANEGSTELPEQAFYIRNNGGGRLSWHARTDCSWLDVIPFSGTSAGDANNVTLVADVSHLRWGRYDCNVTVSDPNASNSFVTVPVSLQIIGPIMSVSSNRLDFEAGKENPAPPNQTLAIQNIGGGTLNWQITTPNDCNWLSVYPLTGQSTGQINEVTLSVDATGLEYGSYSCQLLISDSNAQHGSETIQVSLTVQAPLIAAQPTNFQLRAWRSDPCLCEGALYIHNQGGDTLNWEISAPNDSNWLSIYPLTGQSRGDVNEVTLTVDTSGLADGLYSCTLTISDPNAANSPQTVNVFLHLGLEEGRLCVPDEFPTIQLAIDWALPGDVVVVWPGTYTGPGNRDIDFRGKAITVQSTDPNNPAVVASTVIDCNGGPSNYHRGFDFHTAEDGNSIVAGFTIINGYATEGAGIRITAGRRGEPQTGPVKCRIFNCMITRNTAIYDGGGGVYIFASSPTITNCTITDNKSRSGGGIFCSRSDAVVTNCKFARNSASFGGGASCYSEANVLILANCTFTSNSASIGGAVYSLGSSPSITCCTISENTALSAGGALYCYYPGKPTIANSILYFNAAPQGPEVALDTYYYDPSPLNLTVSYSNVRGGPSAVWNQRGAPVDWGPGNIDTEPYFVDVNNGDYHLKSGGWRWDAQRKTWTWDTVTSRCIDAGDPDAPLRDEPLFVPVDPTGYWGANLRVNMGAYGGTAEASIPPHDWAIRTDYNNDGIANFTDFAYWTKSHPYTGGGPLGLLNPSPALDPLCLAVLAADWLDQTTWFQIPGQATTPNPPDGSVGIRLDPVLSWERGFGASSHDVYFGTSDPPTFRASTTARTFAPGYLSTNTTYYWRIDEVNPLGTTAGPLWTFTTTSFLPR